MHFNFLKTYNGHNSKSYGSLTLTPVYPIHPVIVHFYTNFQLSLETKCGIKFIEV